MNGMMNDSSPGVPDKTATAPTGFTGKVLNYSYNTSNAANTWFFTQGLNLTAGVSYRIKYKYANATGATQYPERVKVAYGSSATSAAMTNIIADHGNIIGGTVTNTFTDFTPSATGVYYIGFQAYSLPDMNQIYVDDINIEYFITFNNELEKILLTIFFYIVLVLSFNV